MVNPAVVAGVNRSLSVLKDAGIAVDQAVIFGAQARGEAHEWRDIDLLVTAAQFDDTRDRRAGNLLWQLAARIASRIEPLPCGSRQWLDDDGSAIIEIARREGTILPAA